MCFASIFYITCNNYINIVFYVRDDDGWTVDTSNNDIKLDWRQGDSLGIQTMENGGKNLKFTEIYGSVDMVINVTRRMEGLEGKDRDT